MDFTVQRAAQIVAILLIAIVASQAIYTALYVAAPDVPRGLIWGIEGILFLAMAPFAASPMVHSKTLTVGWAAIVVSAILNLVQVAVGVTMFGPFREGAEAIEGTAPMAGAVVAFSFFIYNGAKVLLGLAAVIFGLAKMKSSTGGAKALGGLAVFAGLGAIVTNAAVVIFGRIEWMPSGAFGVVATLLLALTITSAVREEQG